MIFFQVGLRKLENSGLLLHKRRQGHVTMEIVYISTALVRIGATASRWDSSVAGSVLRSALSDL